MIEEIDMTGHRPSMRKILVIGTYGAGKTHFISTAPKPIAIFSFDKGYDTVAMTPGIKVISVLEDTRLRPQAWLQFRQRWARLLSGEEYTWPDGRKERFKTIGLDSLTFLSEMCMNHYQYMGQNVDKKATFTQYQQILENMTDIINDAKRSVEYVICTALTKLEKDELSGEVLSLPAMLGSIRDGIGAQFDAVFYFYTDKTPQGAEVFRMKTVGGYREKAKIRLPADIKSVVGPTIEDPNLERLLKLVDSRIEEVYGARPIPPAAGETSQAPEPAVAAQPSLPPQGAAAPVPVARPSIVAAPMPRPVARITPRIVPVAGRNAQE